MKVFHGRVELVFDPRSERLFLPGLGLGIDSVLLVVDTRKRQLETIIHGFGYNVVGITLDETSAVSLYLTCRASCLWLIQIA